MPILVKAASVPPQEALLPPVPEAWAHTRVTITGRNGQGEEIPLTGFGNSAWPGILIQPGATGLDMPSYALFSDEAPNLDGSIYRNARATAREIMIPVYLHGIDRRTVNSLKRDLFRALNPRWGYCVLAFTEGDGSTRTISAYYKDGMEGAEGETAGFTWARYGLQFTAMDPYFYPTRPESIRWRFGTGRPLLSRTAAFYPMKIADGVMGGDGKGLPIENPGDEEAWPVWTLEGPIKSFNLTGPDGASISASPPLDGTDLVPTGRTLTIDTRPGRKTAKDDRGVNYWPRLAANPHFWSISPGSATANISIVTGSGDATVTLKFTPRYASYI